MKLRRYCVTVMDNWTPMRRFWTLKGAQAFRDEHRPVSHLFVWAGDQWIERQ